jgi:hypothetical protein
VAAAVARQAVGGAVQGGLLKCLFYSCHRGGARGAVWPETAGGLLRGDGCSHDAPAPRWPAHRLARRTRMRAGRGGAHLAVVFLRHTTFPPLIA